MARLEAAKMEEERRKAERSLRARTEKVFLGQENGEFEAGASASGPESGETDEEERLVMERRAIAEELRERVAGDRRNLIGAPMEELTTIQGKAYRMWLSSRSPIWKSGSVMRRARRP